MICTNQSTCKLQEAINDCCEGCSMANYGDVGNCYYLMDRVNCTESCPLYPFSPYREEPTCSTPTK